MVPNASHAALYDIQSLVKDLNVLIPDANSVGLDRESLMDKKYMKQVLVIGNMEVPDQMSRIHEVDLLYINSWNEFFCISVPPESLNAWMKKNRTPRTEISIWLPRENKSKGLVNSLQTLLS
jgi:hypothetical protein